MNESWSNLLIEDSRQAEPSDDSSRETFSMWSCLKKSLIGWGCGRNRVSYSNARGGVDLRWEQKQHETTWSGYAHLLYK